jgi:hypothetical protein
VPSFELLVPEPLLPPPAAYPPFPGPVLLPPLRLPPSPPTDRAEELFARSAGPVLNVGAQPIMIAQSAIIKRKYGNGMPSCLKGTREIVTAR